MNSCILFYFRYQRSRFNKTFYIVLIVKSSDEECVTGERFAEPHPQEAGSKDSNYAGRDNKITSGDKMTLTIQCLVLFLNKLLAPVVQRVDNSYSADKFYPLESAWSFEGWIALSSCYPTDKVIHVTEGSITFYLSDNLRKNELRSRYLKGSNNLHRQIYSLQNYTRHTAVSAEMQDSVNHPQVLGFRFISPGNQRYIFRLRQINCSPSLTSHHTSLNCKVRRSCQISEYQS